MHIGCVVERSRGDREEQSLAPLWSRIRVVPDVRSSPCHTPTIASSEEQRRRDAEGDEWNMEKDEHDKKPLQKRGRRGRVNERMKEASARFGQGSFSVLKSRGVGVIFCY